MTFITIQYIFTGLLYIKSSPLFSTEISRFTQKYITKENWLQTVYFVFGVIVVNDNQKNINVLIEKYYFI